MDTTQVGHRPRPTRVGRTLLGLATAGTIFVAGSPPALAHAEREYMAERRHLVERARTQQGTPYRYGGSSPGGFDCSGFTRWVFAGHGADLPRTSAQQFALGDNPANRRIVQRRNLKLGDLVFHHYSDSYVGHVGIYVGQGNFISATSSEGIQIRSLYDPYYWGERWVGGVRLRVTQDVKAGNDRTNPRPPQRRSRSQSRGR